MGIDLETPKGICMVEGCGKKAISKGYCMTHYQQLRRCGHLIQDREALGIKPPTTSRYQPKKFPDWDKIKQEKALRENTPEDECLYHSCKETVYRKHFCKKHYDWYSKGKIDKDGNKVLV